MPAVLGASLVPCERGHVHFITRRLPVEVANALACSGCWLGKLRSETDHSLSIYGNETTQNWPCKRTNCYETSTLLLIFQIVLFATACLWHCCGLALCLVRRNLLTNRLCLWRAAGRRPRLCRLNLKFWYTRLQETLGVLGVVDHTRNILSFMKKNFINMDK